MVTTALGGLTVPAVAKAREPDQAATRGFNIPAQSLNDALTDFGQQSGLQISVDAAAIRGVPSPGVTGTMPAPRALSQILTKTGFTFRLNGTVVTLERAPLAGDAIQLGPVRVEGDGSTARSAGAETAVGAVPGYVARRAATATKTDTPIIETPQSVTVVTADQIEALKSPNLTDAFAYSAGVFRAEDVDSTRDQMIVRGFELDAEYGSYFRDGLKYAVNGFNGQQEPYGLERIELLRGAASVLYGLAAPGGLVNTVTKRPTTNSLHELNLEVGSFDRRQMSGDFSGAVDAEGRWSYRLTALARDSDTFTDHVPDNRVYIAPALEWRPDAATSLTLLADYQHDRTAYRNGLPPSGTLLSNPNGQLPRSRFVGEPDFDKYVNDRYSITSLFERRLGEAVTLRSSVRYLNSRNTYQNVGIGAELDTDGRTTTYRAANRRRDRSSLTAADTSLKIAIGQGLVQHTMLAGVDFAQAKHQSERFSASASALDVFAPVYGKGFGEFVYQDYSWRYKSDRLGLYLQDQIKVANRWVLSVAGRQDWVKDRYCAFDAPSTCAADEKSDAFTWRSGLVYLAENGLSPFVSYSRSWEPTSGLDRAGTRFKPTAGKQYEAGVRFQPPGAETLLSVALYQLTRSNVLVDDPVNATAGDYFQVQQGKVRSRGVELEAKTKIAQHVSVIASYAYTDAKTLESSPLTPELEGKRTGGVPKNQASLWMERETLLQIDGLTVGAGVRYVGSASGLFTDLVTPAYTLFDGLVAYDTGRWRFAINASNLGDKTYVALCPYNCFYGEPRNVKASIRLRW